MSPRRLSIVLLAPLLALTACRESKVTAYRIPKETDPTPEMPAGHPAMPGMEANAGGAPSGAPGDMANTPVPTVTGDGLTWSAPSDWKLQPSAPMRKASFAVSGPEGSADMSITAFPGDVGGELANINRWRGQVGYPALTADNLDQSVDRTEINGLHFAIVELVDPSKPKGTLGALVPYAGGVWFFKLTGPTALVARQKAEFRGFLQTVKGALP